GNIVLVNAKTESYFGFRREELLGRPVEIMVPTAFRQQHIQRRRHYVAEPVVKPMGSRNGLPCLRKDGTSFLGEISLHPISTDEGILIYASIRDITERIRIEEQIQTNLQIQAAMNEILHISLEPISLIEMLQRTLERLLAVAWISLESKGAIFLMEGEPGMMAMKAQFGLSSALLDSCRKVPHGRCLCGTAMATGEIVFTDHLDSNHEITYPGIMTHGHFCVPILSDGQCLGIINLYVRAGHQRKPEEDTFLSSVAKVLAGAIRRKQSEEALRLSEERFNLAVEGSEVGIWDLNLETAEIYYSNRLKDLLGHSSDEISPSLREWEIRLHPEDFERAMTTLHNYLEGRSEAYELEQRLRHKDGSFRWFLARGAAVRNHEGKPYRMVGSILDITRLKLAEKLVKENEIQLYAAKRIQQHILPRANPEYPGFDIAGFTFPAVIAAGDSFDYLSLKDGSLGLCVADATGHGYAPAILMASTQAHLRSLALTYTDPGVILTLVNASLFKETEDNHFVTLFLGQLQVHERTFLYCSAGHPTGYVLDVSGQLKTSLKSTGVPLGLFEGAPFAPGCPVDLQSGDLLVLLTDGILEAESPEGVEFGEERTLAVIRENRERKASEIIDRLHQAVMDYANCADPADDMTVLIVKVLGGSDN
ncbi:MAG: SpoIIE family protein phosphatase, partial [Syntrophales bacterium LBB04]|nr:SpoIIE family protein phosphatase [Syntrophales bacterium LBB04]